MSNIKISVIIPVYNCEEYIGTTLKSVINQNFKDYEIIVIDDGSTDNSLEIIKLTLKGCGIKYKIIHQKNAGVSVARNQGILASEGEFLVFVDGDDYILENHLSELYVEGYDFTLTQFAKKHDDRLSNYNNFDFESILTDEFIKKELNMEILFNFFQLAYKADIIKGNNIFFTPGVVYGEDIEFALKALIHGDRIHVSNEVTYYYIQRYDSAIRTTEYRRFDVVEIFENLSTYYRIHGKNKQADLIIYSRIPRAIFGNMNYFFYSCYGFEEVMYVMKKKNLFSKLARFRGNLKFKIKVQLFLLNPKLYYKMWFRFKNSID
ncbi:glycosyltransferase family 2 protein [uncultured Methanobrevibacter sp.]|uniref:glycosyltransferase family 2 protein n=1 Tax=uncultured Methanobrevibacter sp. TaxID=253161 RepID=UPI0025F2DB94|nr:glycosyltransferase family 2 protein [uncultured Methanobrevibacter sp.]